MKKTAIILTIFAIFSLMLIRGFQLLHANGVHIMDGKISAAHEMPAAECNSKSCFMATQAALLLAVIFSGSTAREFFTTLSLLLCALAVSLFLTDQYRLRKRRERPPFFLSVPFAVSTVIFRE